MSCAVMFKISPVCSSDHYQALKPWVYSLKPVTLALFSSDYLARAHRLLYLVCMKLSVTLLICYFLANFMRFLSLLYSPRCWIAMYTSSKDIYKLPIYSLWSLGS
jgi:hypothetical protein